MTVKERILSIRLSERIDRQPEYANRIGVSVETQKEGQNNRAIRNEGKKV